MGSAPGLARPGYRSRVGEFRLETQRLALRDWHDADRAPFAAMNSDPAVMEFFPRPLLRAESDALVAMFQAELDEKGYCPWAVENISTGAFIGFVGLHAVPAYMAFAPGVEVGWRLAAPYWGHGYASEAGAAALRFGFGTLELDEIVSFTSVVNLRSRRVMERLGMPRDEADDFDHPNIDERHPLRPHVLHRLSRGDQSP